MSFGTHFYKQAPAVTCRIVRETVAEDAIRVSEGHRDEIPDDVSAAKRSGRLSACRIQPVDDQVVLLPPGGRILRAVRASAA